MFLESQFTCFAGVLSYFASWSVYEASYPGAKGALGYPRAMVNLPAL